ALGRIAPSGNKEVVNGLRAALKDKGSADVRANAAAALGSIGSKDKDKLAGDLVGDLIPALKDADWQVRRNAAAALGSFGPQAAKAATPLAELINDKDPLARISAVEALGRIGEPGLPGLVKAVRSPHQDVRHAAMTSLLKQMKNQKGVD